MDGDQGLGSTDPNRCQYFVPRKKRNCRMLVKSGKRFCGEHSILDSAKSETEIEVPASDRDRIPCPYDPKHTCDRKKLDTHLKKCRSKPVALPGYCVKGINVIKLEQEDQTQLWTIGSVSDEQLLRVIEQVDTAYDLVAKDKIQTLILDHEALEEEMKTPNFGPAALKHLKQNASLLGHLQRAQLLQDKSVFVEFGSGRGQLTFWLTKAVTDAQDNTFILVDRESHRHKFDNRLKDMTEVEISRIRVDIADLLLKEVPEVKNSGKPVVGVSKHLCGVATDLAMMSLRPDAFPKASLGGLMIALCCHHRCEWSHFVGKDLLLSHGFTSDQFRLLCGLTSWATCGTGKPRDKPSSNEVPKGDPSEPRPESRYDRLQLDRDRREEIGRKTKRLLDFARLHFAKTVLGLEAAQLFYYCEPETSLENVVLVAKACLSN